MYAAKIAFAQTVVYIKNGGIPAVRELKVWLTLRSRVLEKPALTYAKAELLGGRAKSAVGCALRSSAVILSTADFANAQSTVDPSPRAIDASGLIAAAAFVSEVVRRFIGSVALVPGSLVQAVRWVGSPGDWLAIAICTVALIAAALAARRLVVLPGTRGRHFGRWLLQAAIAVGVVFILHLALPVDGRVRAISFAVFLCIAFVGLGAGLVRYLLHRSSVKGEDPLVRIATLGFTLIALGYFVLGLMRLSGGQIEARLVVGMIFWLALVAVSARFIVQFRLSQRRAPDATARDAAGAAYDPIFHLLSRRMEWFFGIVLTFIAVLGTVTALREGPSAFRSGALAILLLGGLPAAMSLLPLPGAHGEVPAQPWRSTIRQCGRLVVFISFWLILAWLFDVNLMNVATDRFGERAARVLIDVGIAVALAYLLWQVSATALDSLASREVPKAQPEDPEHPSARGGSRIQTFIPLLRTITVAFTVVATGLIVLASLGVDIGPLLAGAGIFGIAIGFGSQALVKDVISGLFFLADDAFRIGEYVEIGSAKGTIESISIRSMKVRHPRGGVFTVPFGDIGIVNNQSRDWAIIKLEFLVDFSTDLKKAKQIVRDIGTQIAADAELGKALLQPVKFQGVRRMEPFGMVVGVKFMAIPGEQFVLKREVYARVKDAFAAADIRFARPRVQVDGSPGPLSMEALEAAAVTAISGTAPPVEGADATKPE